MIMRTSKTGESRKTIRIHACPFHESIIVYLGCCRGQWPHIRCGSSSRNSEKKGEVRPEWTPLPVAAIANKVAEWDLGSKWLWQDVSSFIIHAVHWKRSLVTSNINFYILQLIWHAKLCYLVRKLNWLEACDSHCSATYVVTWLQPPH